LTAEAKRGRALSDIFIFDADVAPCENSGFVIVDDYRDAFFVGHLRHFPKILVEPTQFGEENLAQSFRCGQFAREIFRSFQMNLQSLNPARGKARKSNETPRRGENRQRFDEHSHHQDYKTTRHVFLRQSAARINIKFGLAVTDNFNAPRLDVVRRGRAGGDFKNLVPDFHQLKLLTEFRIKYNKNLL
jgi:hypothetical protein